MYQLEIHWILDEGHSQTQVVATIVVDMTLLKIIIIISSCQMKQAKRTNQ